MPAHGHDAGKEQDGHGHPGQPGAPRQPGRARLAHRGAQDADDEHQLPGQRVEEPDIAGLIHRPGQVVLLHAPPQHQRQRQGQRTGQARHHQQQRQGEEQRDVHRQHVQVHGPIAQDKRIQHRFQRAVEEGLNIEFLNERGVSIAYCHPRDLRDEEDEQQDVGRVELPAALEHLHGHVDEAALFQRTAIDQCGRVARDEDEDLGGVAEAEVAEGDLPDAAGRDVVDEDEPQRQAPEEVQPQVARRLDRGG